MSNYHILEGRPDGNQFRVVFHLPVPDDTNAVGFNYRSAVAAQIGPLWVSAVPHITTAEGDQVRAGELYELIWRYNTHPGIPLLDKRDELDAKFLAFSDPAHLQARLEFYGFDR